MSDETAKTRQFLQKRFNDPELNALCADYFPDVYDDFTDGMRKSQKVQLLLDHCQNQQRWTYLMAALEQERPAAYTQLFVATLKTEAVRPIYARPQRDPRKVFISHAIGHAPRDVEFAHRLATDLQVRGWQTWIAPRDVPPGVKWQKAIDWGLEESGVLVLVLTPKAAASSYVEDETYTAIRLEKEGKMHFLPLLVEDCEMPPSWSAYQHISFQSDYKASLQVLFEQLQPETMAHLAQLYGQLQTAISTEEWGQAQNLGGQIEAQYPDYQDVAGLLARAIEGQKQQEAREKKLASHYQQLHKAIENGDWEATITTGQQIQSINQNYRDVAQLLDLVNESLQQQEYKEQLASYYQQLEEAVNAEKWDAALKIGRQIQAVDQNYRDAPQLLAQAQEASQRQERETKLAQLYQQLKSAASTENWKLVLDLGRQIQQLDKTYQDVVRQITLAQKKLELPKQQTILTGQVVHSKPDHSFSRSKPVEVNKSDHVSTKFLGMAIGMLVIIALVITLGSKMWSSLFNSPGLVTQEPVFVIPSNANLHDSLERPKDKMIMVYVPGGTFMMGSSDSDLDARANELPQHEEVVTNFWIDKYEVTNAQYKLCVSSGVCSESFHADDDAYNGSNYPVVGVSWEDARNYCSWVGGELPTESQWEYAARGKDNRIYPWGNDLPTCNLAQFRDCSGYTVPVGSFLAGTSWVDAADMAGNVWEWTAERYQSNMLSENDSNGIRGGGWSDYARDLRSANRRTEDLVTRGFSIGFRCVWMPKN